MYSDSRMDIGIEQSIEAKDLDTCKQILFDRYKTNFTITDYKTIFRPKWWIFGQKPVVVAKYMVKEPRYNPFERPPVQSAAMPGLPSSVPASARDFNSSKKEILEKFLQQQQAQPESPQGGGGSAVTTFMQNAQIMKKLDELSKQVGGLSPESAKKDEHESIVKVDRLLKQNEFTDGYIKKMNERLRAEFSLEELDDFAAVQTQVADWIGEDIHVAESFRGKNPHIIIIVGPTGVGKTTTIAKLAAKVQWNAKKNGIPMAQWPVMHMITIDNIRVAALEQIEHYANALYNDVSVEQVASREKLESLIQLYNSPQVKYVFIDTSGISPNDFEHIATMKKVLDVPKMHADIYLAVSASTKPTDLEKIIRIYEPFGFRSVIITKCDETTTYGNVLSVLIEKGKTISMITTKQDVLNGHERANPYYFLKRLDGFELDDNHIRQRFDNAREASEEKLAED